MAESCNFETTSMHAISLIEDHNYLLLFQNTKGIAINLHLSL